MTTVATIAATVPVRGQEKAGGVWVRGDEEGADVIGAFVDSLKLLMIEHSFRIAFQDKTRRERNRAFARDYAPRAQPRSHAFQCGERQVSEAPRWEAAQLEVANGSHFQVQAGSPSREALRRRLPIGGGGNPEPGTVDCM